MVLTQEMIDNVSKNVSSIMFDLKITESDENLRMLSKKLTVARSDNDIVQMYRLTTTLFKYLEGIQKNSMHIHYYSGNTEVVVLQDVRYGKVVSIREYDLQEAMV